jgi:DNA polymerase I-like protein with 3'-5' exonuclease and polymerase domains
MAANMPVQAGAQGIIKLAMGELWWEWPKTEWAVARWLMQIHDSLVLEMPDDDEFVRGCLGYVHDVMCGAVKLLVPVKADFKVGKQWGELEEIRLEGKR